MAENSKTTAEDLLYECIRELSFIREVPCNVNDLHSTALGAGLIHCGMAFLCITGLTEDTLDAQRQAEWDKLHATNEGGE